LIHRSISDHKDMAFYATFGSHTRELKELAAVAGLHWTIEQCLPWAKGETALDHCEARAWRAGLRARLLEARGEASFNKANRKSLSAAA
jgi:hypothetical protein